MAQIAIIGFGREGKALLKHLRAQKPKPKVTILDRKDGPNYLKNLDRFDLVYRSPGVPYNLPEIQKAIRRGVRFSSATELFFQKAKGKIIGVTGTKGKGTTSTLIYQLLKNGGKDVHLAGNIGKPAIAILKKLKTSSITVMELSSFQLQDLKYSPEVAVMLGMFPDHMDAHKNFKEYFAAKANIARFQSKKDRIFYVASNKYSKKIAKLSKGRKIPVLADSNLYKVLRIRGTHNLINATVASKVAKSFGVSRKVIDKTLRSYRGLHFRLEEVGKVNGVKIYNDSASTNPMTTVAAINAFKEPTILMMGGGDKNLSFAPVKKALKNSKVRLVIIYGENRNKIFSAIKGPAKTKVMGSDLKAVVRLALSEARVGDSIVLSPGSTSFDMFKNYEDRGEKFNKIVKRASRDYTSLS